MWNSLWSQCHDKCHGKPHDSCRTLGMESILVVRCMDELDFGAMLHWDAIWAVALISFNAIRSRLAVVNSFMIQYFRFLLLLFTAP